MTIVGRFLAAEAECAAIAGTARRCPSARTRTGGSTGWTSVSNGSPTPPPSSPPSSWPASHVLSAAALNTRHLPPPQPPPWPSPRPRKPRSRPATRQKKPSPPSGVNSPRPNRTSPSWRPRAATHLPGKPVRRQPWPGNGLMTRSALPRTLPPAGPGMAELEAEIADAERAQADAASGIAADAIDDRRSRGTGRGPRSQPWTSCVPATPSLEQRIAALTATTAVLEHADAAQLGPGTGRRPHRGGAPAT